MHVERESEKMADMASAEEEEEEEKECEDWCFVCKDGGTLIICERPDCPKVYHARCVEMNDPDGESGDGLICKWHTCYLCGKASKLFCFCCPNAVCRSCVVASEFTRIKETKGLCNECLELVLILEELQKYDATGDKIDLTDPDTAECLFLEYWNIIKDREGLTAKDVGSAVSWKKGVKRRYRKDPKYSPSDSDIGDAEDYKPTGPTRTKKRMKFIGWGSKSLINFLTSIGKDTSEKLEQSDVNSIIIHYIHEKNLLDHGKKKRVHCDEKLRSIFRRKSVNINRIYRLLESHFKENFELEKDVMSLERESCFSEKRENVLLSCKKHKREKSDEKTCGKEMKPEFRSSGLASINADNIRLVYLRKSLVEELLKQNESCGDKVVGSFVKVKNDHRDCMQGNLYQILQVTGIKKISTADDKNRGILLHASGVSSDVCISKLADSDITEEEIEDLKQKVMNGLLRQPTVVEMEQKAKVLHEDITKHWIAKQLVILQNRINYANEKGRRGELGEYLVQRELLEQPAEQERLLRQTPKIIEDMFEVKTGSTVSWDSIKQEGSNSVTEEVIVLD